MSSVTDTTEANQSVSDTAMIEYGSDYPAAGADRRMDTPMEEAARSYSATGDDRPADATTAGSAPDFPQPSQNSDSDYEGVIAENRADGDNASAQDEPVALAVVSAVDDGGLEGEVRFQQQEEVVRITGELSGLEPGKHGLHVHQNGSCGGDNAERAGEHFSPDDDPHGSPRGSVDEHHAGDLGNIVANEDGSATIDISDPEITLTEGPYGIVGKTLVVHAGEDDLDSQPSGDSGDPVGCGVIRGERIAQNPGNTGR